MLMATEDQKEADGIFPMVDEWDAREAEAPEAENPPEEAMLRDGEGFCGRGLIDRMHQLKQEVGENIFKYVKKLHNGLGHPSAKVLTQTLENAQAKKEIVHCASKYECAVCASRKPPPTAIKSGPPPATTFNERVQMDVFYVQGERKRFLSCIW